MQITSKNLSDTKVRLSLVADAEQLQTAKQETLADLGKNMKLQGFRAGKTPPALVEKNADPATLQSEFLDRALNAMYSAALQQEKLRPVDRPEVKITKFVPFDTLEIDAEVEVVGEITLPDYKKLKITPKNTSVTAKEVDDVLANLRSQSAAKKDVTRVAKNGDQVLIDFSGTDAKTKEPIQGAEGKQYPLVLGSDAFIPGFESNLVGMKAGEEKTFTVAFPKDYGVKSLQNRKVTFAVTVTQVQELAQPKLDDAFAATIGQFKTLAELKTDIKKQLGAEKEQRAEQEFVDELMSKIAEKTKVAIPHTLIHEQVDRLVNEQKQNLVYRGQTWEEFLESEGVTEEEYRASRAKDAELRVRAGLALAEIAEHEQITVTPKELEARMQQLKIQYKDAAMQGELDKPSARRDIASRMMSEKTIDKLKSYARAA